MTFKTEQESFWAGDFGAKYIERNQGEALLASNIDFFSKSLRLTRDLKNCIEFGANVGMNIKAIKLLHPAIDCHAIEINSVAAKQLSEEITAKNIYNQSILAFTPLIQYDLTLIKGVLIHMNPDVLPQVYEKLFASCGRYLLIAEYYNPSPVAISYRGHSDRLYKRDFAGEIMDQYPQLQLLDYGFSYHRDLNFPQDDITWFLMEKR